MTIPTTANPSEAFVSGLASKSFLSLWCYYSPLGKEKRKELCDVLVVCDPDIIIISVKDCHLSQDGNSKVKMQRWQRKAIEASVNQIYGAERILQVCGRVFTREGIEAPALPTLERRRFHRLAVAFGGNGNALISYGDFGKGFVHVLDEISLRVLMKELNTITDFVTYLKDKEDFCEHSDSVDAGEEDLLAFYLSQGRQFPVGKVDLLIDDGLWERFRNNPQYIAKERENQASYIWDNFIEMLIDDFRSGRMFGNPKMAEFEMALRCMARENRFNRRILGKAFHEFLELAEKREVRSRYVPSLSGTTYVFLARPHGTDREDRYRELGMRAFVARSIRPQNPTVVGIATETPGTATGCSIDLVYLHISHWTPDLQGKAEVLTKEGYFRSPRKRRINEMEFPIDYLI